MPERSGPHVIASAAKGAEPDAGAAGSVDAAREAPLAPLDWGTRAPGAGPLFPIVDGMCIHGTIFRLENGAVFAYGMSQGPWSRGGATTAELVGDAGLEPLTDEGFGKAFGVGTPSVLGGRAPDRLWAVVDVSSRMVAATDFYTGGLHTSDWKLLLPSGAKSGDAGNARTGNTEVRQLHAAGTYGPGQALFLESASGLGPSGELRERRGFRVLGADGAWVASPKVPGADLAKLADGAAFTRLANGEVLGLSPTGGADKLVRWSPTQAVRDLPLPKRAKSARRLVGGTARAVMELDGELFVYDGERLAPSKLAARLTPGFTWALAPDDTLYVMLADRTLLEESASGAVTEGQAPATGVLAGLDRGALWLIASGKGPGGADIAVSSSG